MKTENERTGERLLEERLVQEIHEYDRLGEDAIVLKKAKMLCYMFPNNELSKKLISGNPDYFKGPSRFIGEFIRVLMGLFVIGAAKTAYNAQKKINSDTDITS